MYEEDRQVHGWMTFRIGEEKMLYISNEGTRSSAVGNNNKKAMRSPQLKNVEDIKNRRIGHQRELP